MTTPVTGTAHLVILGEVGGGVVIRVLGGFAVEVDGRDVTPASVHQRRLLGALVLADGAAVPTARLVDVLWGQAPPASARNSLQTYVARLRQVVGPQTLLRRADAYVLPSTAATVDAREAADRLRALRRDAERAADVSTAGVVVAGLEAVLDGWPPGAWGDLAAEDAFAPDAERIRLLRGQAVELLAETLLRTNRPAEAVEQAQRLLADAGRLDEPATSLLARAMAASGRVPEALEVLRAHGSALADELGLDPGPAVRALEQDLLSSRPVAPPPLPPPQPAPQPAPPSLVGREDDLDRVRTALGAARLVTVVGTGGVGKTALVRHVAAEHPGLVWVDLAVLRRDADVVAVLGEALQLGPGGERHAAVVAALRGAGPTVVLDNCEHVVTGVAGLVSAALRGPRGRRLLATSREPLDVPGEQVVGLGPLPVPEPHLARADDPAVRLFTDRVTAAGGPAPPPAAAARVVAAVDGLPLAVELAAARAALVPVDQLLERLAAGLDVLQGSPRRYPQRHRSLSDVCGWSHDLLPEQHRVVFRRLSGFTGPFTLADAEDVCSGGALAPRQVSAVLPDLVDCSMVVRVDRPGPGFRLLEPLRQHAAQRCAAAGEEQLVAAAQRRRVLAIAEAVRLHVPGPREAEAVATAELALGDLRAVRARAVDEGDALTAARLAGDLYPLSYLQARVDLLGWGRALADVRPDDLPPGPPEDAPDLPDVWARAVAAAAAGEWLRGDLPEAARLAGLAAAAARGPTARAVVAEVLGDLALARGELRAAVRSYAELRTVGRTTGKPALEGYGAACTAVAHVYAGSSEDARREIDDGTALAVRGRSALAEALARYAEGELLADVDPEAALSSLAATVRLAGQARATMLEGIARTSDVALRGRAGDPLEALERYRSALRLWRDAAADGILATTLRNLVVLLARCGADEQALRLDDALSRVGARDSYGVEASRLQRAVAASRSRHGTDVPRDEVADVTAAADLALTFVSDAIEVVARPVRTAAR